MIIDDDADIQLSPTPHEEANDISIIQDVQIIEMSQSRYQSHNHQRIESEPSWNPTENLITSSNTSNGLPKSDGKLQVGKIVRNLKRPVVMDTTKVRFDDNIQYFSCPYYQEDIQF